MGNSHKVDGEPFMYFHPADISAAVVSSKDLDGSGQSGVSDSKSRSYDFFSSVLSVARVPVSYRNFHTF